MKDEKEFKIDQEYLKDLEEIKETIRINQNKAMVVTNQAMIISYYRIGQIINKRKKRGKNYVVQLSIDLKDKKGCSYDNLNYMSKFAAYFSLEELFDQPGRIIAWRTIIEIMKKCNSHEEMLWYIKQTYINRWSRSMLINQISMKAFERNQIEPIVSEEITESNNELINSLFKDTYVFDFLDRENIKTEKDLKDKMIDNILSSLEEFGKGFSLVGKEYKLITPTNKEFKIDLLLYHTKLHAYIVIEVKSHEFRPSDYGQLIFYVNALDSLEKEEMDNSTIGLLLCKEADEFVARTTMVNSKSLVGISKYKFIEELPSYLVKKLNVKK